MTRLVHVFSMTAALFAAAGAVRGQSDDAALFRSYQAHMAAAEKALRLDEARELRRWLDGAPEAMRGWEWKYLNGISDTSLRTVAAPDTPIRIAMAPDGAMVATVEGPLVRLWSWPALEPMRTIEGHADAIYRAEFSPDGTRLVTVARDVTSRVWDIATGQEIARIDLVNPAFAAATFSPDGALVATCAWERDESGVFGLVWVWDPRTGEVRARQRVGVKPLSSIRFTPDGASIVTGSWDGLVHVLDTGANEVRRLTMPDDGIYNAVNDIAISPDGAVVAAASKDRTVRVFSIESGGLLASLRGHVDYVEGLAFSPDGSVLASTSGDTTIRLWNANDWSALTTMRGGLEAVRGAVWTPDGSRLISCAMDNTLRVWDPAARHGPQFDINTGENGIYSCAFSADGRTLAVSCYSGELHLYDAATGERRAAWTAHPDSTCHAAVFSADGTRLATCSWDKTVRVWNVASHEPIAIIEAGAGVYSCAISPDGTRIALTAGAVQVWDIATNQRLHTFAAEGDSSSRLEFSPDGTRLVAGFDGGAARIYDLQRGEMIATLECGSGRVEAVAFSPDGARVITGDAAGVVRAFPASGGPALFACDTGGRGVNQVAVSRNRIAAGTDQLWLIDLERGGTVLGRRPLADTLWNLSWSPDGRRIAVQAINGTIAVLGRPGP